MVFFQPAAEYPGDVHAVFQTRKYFKWRRSTRNWEGKWTVFADASQLAADDLRSREYDAVGPPQFDQAGARMGYVAVDQQGARVVVDGVEGPVYDRIGDHGLTFAPDDERIAYAAVRDRKWFVVIDGNEHGPYDEVFYISFHPKNKQVSFGAAVSGRHSVVVPGSASREGPACIFYSPSGDRSAYVWLGSESAAVEIDDVKGSTYDQVSFPRFSSNGRRYAYAARKKRKWRAVIDGVEGPAYKDVDTPVFSDDGSAVAYLAKRGNRTVVVVNGAEVGEYRDAASLAVSPDGSHFAYVAPEKKGRWRLIVDGTEVRDFDRVAAGGDFVFVGSDVLRGVVVNRQQMVRLKIELEGG
jgi:hypothetical protein